MFESSLSAHAVAPCSASKPGGRLRTGRSQHHGPRSPLPQRARL